jgi:ribonuclease-3
MRLALTHRSFLHNNGAGKRESNERLEYLGDSVLGLVCSEWLYRNRPDEHEGQLTKTKSLLVSKAILSRRALAMGLGRFVLLSNSEVESGGRQRLSILADAFEAVIGAIYLDQGLDAAREFITTWLLNEANGIIADKRHTNYKSLLQEYVQSTYHTHPVYRIRSETGPDHQKVFSVEVLVGSRTLGDGRGQNKKEAEQDAARNALDRVADKSAPRRGGSRGERARGSSGRGTGDRAKVAERETPGRRGPKRAPRERGERTRTPRAVVKPRPTLTPSRVEKAPREVVKERPARPTSPPRERIRPAAAPPPAPPEKVAASIDGPPPSTAYGRVGKPATRGLHSQAARADLEAAAPPPEIDRPVSEAPITTPERRGGIQSSAGRFAKLPEPLEAEIVKGEGAVPPGAPADRYRAAESGESQKGPEKAGRVRKGNMEDQDDEGSAP